jgi:hypothetical protein
MRYRHSLGKAYGRIPAKERHFGFWIHAIVIDEGTVIADFLLCPASADKQIVAYKVLRTARSAVRCRQRTQSGRCGCGQQSEELNEAEHSPDEHGRKGASTLQSASTS